MVGVCQMSKRFPGKTPLELPTGGFKCRRKTVLFAIILVFSAFLHGCAGVKRMPVEEYSIGLSANEGGWKNGQELFVRVQKEKLVRIICKKVDSTEVVYDLEVAQGCSVNVPPSAMPGPFEQVREMLSIAERYPKVQCPASFKRCIWIRRKEKMAADSVLRVISFQSDGSATIAKDSVISIEIFLPAETAKYWHLEPTSDERRWRLFRSIDSATKEALLTPRSLSVQGWSDDCIISVVSSRGWYEARVGLPWPSFGKVLLGD